MRVGRENPRFTVLDGYTYEGWFTIYGQGRLCLFGQRRYCTIRLEVMIAEYSHLQEVHICECSCMLWMGKGRVERWRKSGEGVGLNTFKHHSLF